MFNQKSQAALDFAAEKQRLDALENKQWEIEEKLKYQDARHSKCCRMHARRNWKLRGYRYIHTKIVGLRFANLVYDINVG